MIDQKKHILTEGTASKIAADIITEVRNAEAKFPEWPLNLAEGMQIITEEHGEAHEAAIEWRWRRAPLENVRAELIQEAAMCMRQIAMIDRGSPRVYQSGGCPHSG